ncbi:MAG: hypothetical protein ABIE03_06950 [Patescibacteria group bacterium]|nr:hypothetical protein [Patescibacteria group bacterium]
MLTLTINPKNKDKFQRLLEFLRQVLSVCDELKIRPILDGSLAVLAYTQNPKLIVNNVNFSFPEKDYPKLSEALNKAGINAEIKEWHVLQARKDDLKVEFSDINYWFSNLGIPIDSDILSLDDLKFRILKLDTLIAFYKGGIDDTKDDPKKVQKHKDMLEKYHLLLQVQRDQR